jgi:predicted Zn-dependent protease
MFALLAAGCATSPTGKRQLRLFPPQQIAQMGNQAYQQIQQKTPVSQNAAIKQYVDCVVQALTKAVGVPKGGGSWHVTVFKEDNTVNAFALPGGNVGVYTGILPVTKNGAQLAAVIGHEIGHVEAGHANARMSTQYATQSGLQLIQVLAGGGAGGISGQTLMALLGVGAQVGIILPYSRGQESEADVLGERYMAEAGFDPREAIDLWHNMQQAGGQEPPEFLSDHPSNYDRIKNLKKHLPKALDLYKQAQAKGRKPSCSRPTAAIQQIKATPQQAPSAP